MVAPISPSNVGVQLCYTDTDGIKKAVKIDKDTDTLHILNWVYNPTSLAWERMKQPSVDIGDLTVTQGDMEKLLSDHYYLCMQPFLYASDRIKYICKNTDVEAIVADTDWLVWKFTDADIPEKEGPRIATSGIAAVADIDGLSWNI